MNFQYRDPERGFNRGKVKGVVAKLVHLQDPATTTALEVAAGGKLYQVGTAASSSTVFNTSSILCLLRGFWRQRSTAKSRLKSSTAVLWRLHSQGMMHKLCIYTGSKTCYEGPREHGMGCYAYVGTLAVSLCGQL